jgi:hypothetical protein
MNNTEFQKRLEEIRDLKSIAPTGTSKRINPSILHQRVRIKALKQLKLLTLTPEQTKQVNNEIEKREKNIETTGKYKIMREKIADSKKIASKPLANPSEVPVANPSKVITYKPVETVAEAVAEDDAAEDDAAEDDDDEDDEGEEDDEAEEEPSTNKDLIDIGNELYYLGPASKISLIEQQAANDPLSLSNVAFRIQPMSKFIENYCANQHVKNNQNKPVKNMKIISLFRKYLINGVSKKVLALTNDELIASKGVAMSDDDREHLIMFLTWRAEDLEEKQSVSVSNIKDEKIAQNIRKLIIYFTKSATTESVKSSKKDVTDMLIRMTWYLLHPDETPAKIQGDWNNILAEMEKVNLDTIIEAIQTFQETRHMPVSDVTTIRNKIKELLAILGGLGNEDEVEADEDEVEAEKDQDDNDEEMRAIAIAVASLMSTDTSQLKTTIVTPQAPEPEVSVGGAMRDLKSIIVAETMAPIANHMEQLYPMLSVIKEHTIAPSIDLVMPLQQLLRLCAAISNEKHFGFYRITGVPHQLFNYIQHHIQHATNEFHTYNNTYHNKRTRQYFLCIDGNLSYVKQPASKEQKAIKTYFQKGDIYILYTNKEINLADYMEDPYYVYEIAYNNINDRMHIKNTNSLLNKEPVELEKYLALGPHIFDKHQLDLSIFLQLNHLI